MLKHKSVKEPPSKASDQEEESPTVERGLKADIQEPIRKRVQFNVAEVVEFEPTMWTATVSSEGVPVSGRKREMWTKAYWLTDCVLRLCCVYVGYTLAWYVGGRPASDQAAAGYVRD